MKQLIHILLLVVFVAGCKKTPSEDIKPSEGELPNNVKLSFELTANGLPFILDSSFVTNQNYPLEINKLRFYIANILMVNVTDTVAVSPIELVDFEDEYQFQFVVKSGTYSQLVLNFGIPDSLNLGDPTTYPNDSPLGIYGSNGMHWSWLAGYRFLAIDGYAANSLEEPQNIGVSLHTGTANLYQQKVLQLDSFIVNDVINELVIQIPLDQIFAANESDTLDVRTENQSHTFGETAVKVTNRFLNSWQVRP